MCGTQSFFSENHKTEKHTSALHVRCQMAPDAVIYDREHNLRLQCLALGKVQNKSENADAIRKMHWLSQNYAI